MKTVQKTDIQKQMIQAVETVKRTNPMAGSVTNTVTINFVANAQLAVGGSAAMSICPTRANFLPKPAVPPTSTSGRCCRFTSKLCRAWPKFCTTRKSRGFWTLSPSGSRASDEFTATVQAVPAQCNPGNASEIIALAGLWELDGGTEQSKARGVDSTDSVSAAKDAAVALAQWTGGAVAVSGKTDLITDGSAVAFSHGGSHFMEQITGSGCSLGGVAAVYAAAASPFIAALTASSVYNLAGSRAERKADGPGSFQVLFLDELYRATAEEIAGNPFELSEVPQ